MGHLATAITSPLGPKNQTPVILGVAISLFNTSLVKQAAWFEEKKVTVAEEKLSEIT